MEHLPHNNHSGIHEDESYTASPEFIEESKKISLSKIEEDLSQVEEGSEEWKDLQKMKENLENN